VTTPANVGLTLPCRKGRTEGMARQEMTTVFGMEVVPARVEALRSKAKRLVARGWPTELAPGRFTSLRVLPGQAADVHHVGDGTLG
jgi:hypothetical protein